MDDFNLTPQDYIKCLQYGEGCDLDMSKENI